MKDFEKKFKDKTRNNWSDRESFQPVKGKYTLIEMDNDGGDDDADTVEKVLNPYVWNSKNWLYDGCENLIDFSMYVYVVAVGT